MTEPILVLGSGMAAVGAHVALHEAGRPHVLVDKNHHPGGHTATFRDPSGFITQVAGICVTAIGDAPEGEACGDGIAECAAGLECITEDDGAFCRAFCDPQGTEAPAACGGGYVCLQLPLEDASENIVGFTPFGYCLPSCDTWISQEKSGCAEGEYCAPYLYNSDGGVCQVDDGLAGEGQPCGDGTPETTCQAGLMCVGTASGPECSLLCDPEAEPGDDGDTCAETQTCGGLQSNNPDGTSVQLDLGTCLDSCDFHQKVQCTDETLSCSPGELFGIPADVCITPNEGYESWPLDEFAICPETATQGQLCGPNSACFPDYWGLTGQGISEILYCFDICIGDAGTFYQSNHPDCRRETAVCDPELFLEDGFSEIGVCGADG